MSHLTLETLARLVDEEPAGAESAHLAACAACLAELHELRADAATLAALPDVMPPPRAWNSLEARLASEGLIHAGVAGNGVAAARARRRWFPVIAQLAAAIALVGIGTGIGAFALAPRFSTAPGPVTAGSSPTDTRPDRALPVREDPAPARGVRQVAAETQPEDSPRLTPRAVAPPASVRLASDDTPRDPRSADEALVIMREAEMAYLDALTRYAELAGGVAGGDPMARLAALEGIVLTTRAALGQAPADPVINGYHMTALAQREATLRQIAANSTQSWF